jgi:hypothetical protein
MSTYPLASQMHCLMPVFELPFVKIYTGKNIDLPTSVADALPNACIRGSTSDDRVSIICAEPGDDITWKSTVNSLLERADL